ncbi:MAG: hypothetical protein FJX22_04965, partial [Alphaproteobacteria bacterium]|nr:hypothetical protein [Alphaproteobacteria bacterium]
GTDWSVRPLKDGQLAYAAADVQHLPQLASTLKAKLLQKGRLDWLQETTADLVNPASYRNDVRNQWSKLVNHRWKRPRQQLLYGLLLWRDKMAERANRPRRWIISDDILQDLAEAAPTNLSELVARRSLSASWREGDKAATLLAAITEIAANPPALPDTPPVIELTRGQSAFLEMLKLLLKLRAEEECIGAGLLATNHDLQLFAASVSKSRHSGAPQNPLDNGVGFLTGWRHQLFGRFAQQLATGRLSLTYQNGQIVYRMDD